MVLDYLWGASAATFLAAASGHGSREAEPRVRFVQIGSISGNSIDFPGAVLRSSGLELMGSGLGSLSNSGLVRVVGQLLAAVPAAGLTIDAEAVPLAEVESAWNRAAASRLVFTL